jgi:hypothetical protein
VSPSVDVCFWHLADIDQCPSHVRLGESDMAPDWPLMHGTVSGQDLAGDWPCTNVRLMSAFGGKADMG